MKNILKYSGAALLGGALFSYFVATVLNARHAALLASERASWDTTRAQLEASLEEAQARPRPATTPARVSTPVPASATKITPAEWMARLQALQFAPGPGQARATRQAVHALEELLAAGPSALPAIRDYLARNVDVDIAAASPTRGWRVTDDFVIPPSLRFGLLDVVKRIGGADAEKLLADTLGTTARGVEVAWLARALQDVAPDKYRDTALNIARTLLARPVPGGAAGVLDRNDRDHLFSVLALYRDASYISTAQEQLVQADGLLDRAALKYLQQSLGQQAVNVAEQAWNDPRLNDPTKKEPLARVALNYVGADAQANEFYQRAISDLSLPKDHRRNLIEDLNQDGFPDLKNLSARDLPLIQNRLALIERMAPSATDPINSAAFAEAYKDLLKMRERASAPARTP